MTRATLLAGALGGALALAACGSGGKAGPTPRDTTQTPPASTAGTLTTPPVGFKPPKEVLAVGREFIRTAVLRADLARSWDIVTPHLRQKLTRQQWLTGDIPVVPFPKKDFLAARYHVVLASPSEVVFEVLMLPKAGSELQPTRFYLHVVRVGDRWLVDYWVPRGEGGGLPGV
jgi:hypothetical protein